MSEKKSYTAYSVAEGKKVKVINPKVVTTNGRRRVTGHSAAGNKVSAFIKSSKGGGLKDNDGPTNFPKRVYPPKPTAPKPEPKKSHLLYDRY